MGKHAHRDKNIKYNYHANIAIDNNGGVFDDNVDIPGVIAPPDWMYNVIQAPCRPPHPVTEVSVHADTFP